MFNYLEMFKNLSISSIYFHKILTLGEITQENQITHIKARSLLELLVKEIGAIFQHLSYGAYFAMSRPVLGPMGFSTCVIFLSREYKSFI